MNTRKIITEAAFSLFKEFPFDTITVQMILNRSEVSRKTFYKYFADKYELMELYYRSVMDDNLHDVYDGHNWDDILKTLYDFIKLDISYFRHVSDVTGQRSFWEFLREYSFQFYRSIKLHNECRDELTEEERLTILMIVEGQMALFKLLVDGKADVNRDGFAALLCSLMPDSYKDLLHDESDYEYRDCFKVCVNSKLLT
jgi:AcrR family transcriptional regulator